MSLDVEKRFLNDVTEHEMTVEHDDGVYRHLVFKRPDTVIYSFSLVTWPGYLAVCGDMGAYMFRRIHDMFEFFNEDRINPSYWSEKLVTDQQGCMKYSEELFRETVNETVDRWCEELEAEEAENLRHVIRVEVLDSGYSEESASNALQEFDFRGPSGRLLFRDSWEWGLRDFDYRFLWNLHAIVWGIAKYQQRGSDSVGAAAGR